MAKQTNCSDYEPVKKHLCKLHKDEPKGMVKCFTSKNGKCPLANYFCYEYMNVCDLISNTAPNGRVHLIKVLKKLKKQYESELDNK